MLNGLEDVLKADSAKSTKVDCTQAVEEYIGKSDWRIFANANTGYSNAGLVNGLAGKVIANYWLDKVYTKKEGDAHRNGDYHIHDLDSLSGYCAGHDLARLLEEGFNGVTGRVGSKAPKHFREALYQMANFIGILQAEWAGAQAFSSFDTYLAPYAFFDTYYGSITYKDIKKAILNFIYNLNVPSRWGQCVPSTYKALKADGTWATCEDLQVGDEICVIDMETGKIKTDTVTHVNLYNAPEKLHQYQAMDIDRKHQFLVTPNHRVMHYDAEGFYLTESSKLLEANMLVRVPEASLVPFDMEEYVGKEYDITDDELELLSFILALGEFNKSFDRTSRRYKSIIRFKPDRWTLQFADRFKEVAARIGIPVTQSEKINAKSLKHSYPRFDLGSCPASKKLFDILQGSRKKPFPFANELSPRQAAIVVDTFCLLTNSSQTFGIWRIRCASKAVQQMLVNLSIKMGRRVVAERSKHDDPAWQNKFKNRKHKAFRAQSYFLQIYSNRPSTFKIREIDCIYKKVWCPTTNSGTFICMNEDGYVFFTGNSPFSNVTIDWTVPNDMKDQYPLRTGKHYFETIFDNLEFTEENKQNRINFFTELAGRLELPIPDVDNREELINMCQQATYKIFHKEMTIIDKAFYECLNQGDINGLPFTFPIPTVNITEDFDWDGENTDILFENAAKYGSSYFQNFIGSQYKRDENGKLVKDEHAYSPNDVRSMAFLGCQEIIYKDKHNRVGKNELRHLVSNWFKNPDCSYEFLINGEFHKITEMFEIDYKDYDSYYRFTLKNGYAQSYSADHKCAVLNDNNEVEIKLSQDIKEGDKFIISKHPWNIHNNIGNYELGKIVGYYLAEGYTARKERNRLYFAINIQREDIVNDIIEFFNKLGSEVKTEVFEDKNIFKVTVYGTNAVSLMKQFISGDSAKSKRLSSFVWNTDDSFRTGLYDGYLTTDGSEQNRNFAHTTNKDLPDDLIVLASSIGKILSYKVNDKNCRYWKKDKSDLVYFTSYRLDIPASYKETDDYYIVPVKSVEKLASRMKRVYNFTIDTPEHLVELPNGIVSHQCCRLQLDKRELRKRGGGLFGSDAQTGSIGVVTLNMARLGYLYKHNLPGLHKRLNQLLELAKSTLEKKRKFVQEMFLRGLYPYTKRYLRSFDTFFSTIGVNGMNEMVRNFTDDEYDITDPRGQEMCLTLLKNIREKLADFQEETGNLYNLEATPAEGTTYRLAKEDIKRYSDREVAYIECDKHGIVEVPMSELDKGEIECPKCLKEQQE